MINITEYLNEIYIDFKNEIDKGRVLCDLKALTFEATCLPDYNNIQIQRLYLLRYAFAYGFEYSHIYSEALARLHNPNQVAVASIGCGNFIDYWSLIKTIEEKKKIDCTVRYVGIDEIDWNYKVEKRLQDNVTFKRGNAVQFFEKCTSFISDIYFFPKSISEFSSDEITIIANNLKSKPIEKDKIIFCFSIRTNEYSRTRDMDKTRRIKAALESNGYRQTNTEDVSWSFKENKGIISYAHDFLYPQDAYDYVVSLNEKCNRYIEMGSNCEDECKNYLNRKPTTKTGNITYQIMDFERINRNDIECKSQN